MEWDGNTQLRITTWPDRPVPLPRAIRVESRLDDSQTVILPVFEGGVTDAFRLDKQLAVDLTGETYLELEQVDLDDPQSILAFVNRYGCLGGWSAFHDLDQQADDQNIVFAFISLYNEALDSASIVEERQKAVRDQMAVLPDWIPSVEHDEWREHTAEALSRWFPPVVETLEEFRFAARLLLDLKSAWQVARGELKPTEVQWLSDPAWQPPFNAQDELRLAVGQAPTRAIIGNVIEPAQFLGAFLDPLLRWFQPRLDATRYHFPPPFEDEQPEYPTGTVIHPQRQSKRVPLYAICALELFNHIIENAEYHTCANERCRRTFVYQQGRAEKGQRRSRGVLYCAPECARATAQREYRRRRRFQG